MDSLTFEHSTVRHLLFHRQLQVVGCWGVNVSFLCGSNSDFYSEQRQSWLWCLHGFLNNIVYGHSLSKRWLCRIIDGCRSNWFNHEYVFLTFFLSPQHLALLTCHCVCLCVQCFRPHNENLFTSLAKQKPASDLPATISAVVNKCEVKYYESSV